MLWKVEEEKMHFFFFFVRREFETSAKKTTDKKGCWQIITSLMSGAYDFATPIIFDDNDQRLSGQSENRQEASC